MAPSGSRPSDRTEPDSDPGGYRTWSLLAVGTIMASSVGLCTVVGYWLDAELETAPWLLLTGVLLGSTVGFVQMIRIIRRFGK